MTLPRVKYVQTSSGVYDVIAPASDTNITEGTTLGTVRYRERRYNLRRLIVARWWQVSGVEGFNADAPREYEAPGYHKYNTRTEAVAAMLDYLLMDKEFRP